MLNTFFFQDANLSNYMQMLEFVFVFWLLFESSYDCFWGDFVYSVNHFGLVVKDCLSPGL